MVLTVILIPIVGIQNVSYRVGRNLPPVLITMIAAALWAYMSRKSWSWLRFAVTILIFYVGVESGTAFLRVVGSSATAGAAVAEFEQLRTAQQELAQKLAATRDAPTLISVMDELTKSVEQLKRSAAKVDQVAGTRSKTNEKTFHDAIYETGKAFGTNYNSARQLVTKYDSDPNVTAAWERLKSAARPLVE
jgi:hypothetical protein